MFIEELVVDGFKSYSTRVNIGPFDKQFNAITGLNGTGKSNILDSICFVLGISNLQQVRVGKLDELVYKQGQAGVTKASVTVVFNNADKSGSPLGYEAHDKITITRQIVIGGRNRYLINSHNVQANQIQNLFHSVSLNVNNPHFLIMQGRITKVINMKPQETLSMIEEAAGTRMYENKKAGALKTLEKKQNKVEEINRLLAEEITPTLEKLQKERASYMMWVSNNNEVERLQRFCVAFEYMQVKDRLENKNTHLAEMEGGLKNLSNEIQALTDREHDVKRLIKEQTGKRDKQKSETLKNMEDEHSKMSKEVASTETKLKNRESELEGVQSGRKKGQKHLDDIRKQVAEKETAYLKEKEKFDKINEQEIAVREGIEKAQWSMQALTAGVSTAQGPEAEGEGNTSIRGQILAAQTRLSEMESEQKKKAMTITDLRQRINGAEQVEGKSKLDGKRLLKEKSSAESLVAEKRAELEKLGFDADQYRALMATARQGEQVAHAGQEKLDSIRAHIGGIDFRYETPFRGFDNSKVKGVVAKLFHIKPDFASYARALEVSAGGRLYNVVVDDEATGKALLEKGQLRRRVTIVPLNKIDTRVVQPQVVRQAKSIMPQGGDVNLAYEIVGFDEEVQNAMKYVFGGTLMCDSSETAKKVTFHPNVRVRSVTKEGDVYDPAGTVSGGSAPKGGGILQKLQQLAEVEKQVQAQHTEFDRAKRQLATLRATAEKHGAVDRDLKCAEHDLALIDDRINRSEHHAAAQAIQEMKDKATQYEADIKALPEEKKQLEKDLKQYEKDIQSLESGRPARIKQFEKQIEQLKASAGQHADKLEKQREKTEQANAEFEVMRDELLSQETGDQTTVKNNEAMAADIEKLKAALTEQREQDEAMGKQLDALRKELGKLDESLNSLSTELTTNKTQREEKELEQKRVSHKIQQLQKDDQEAHIHVERMEKQHVWIEKEKSFFGKKGTDFDFEANSYQDSKGRMDKLNAQQNKLSKNINKKAMAMFEKAEMEYKDLLQKRDIILNDKKKIEEVIKDLDEKKIETLKRTWQKVNGHFHSIFSTLLPNTSAKLQAPEGMDETTGLEIKVAFQGIWKASLSELSGGQRSLLALSLVLALLLFKPAPMYILDEIDSALDLSHTQNIGAMIRQHFPHSQFIIVSLKEGLFHNANVLFRTRFVDGTSAVARYAIRDADDRVAMPGEEDKDSRKKARKAAA